MSPDSWQFAGVCVTVGLPFFGLLLQGRRQHAENGAKIEQVEKQLRPNGNRAIDEGGSIADAAHRLEQAAVRTEQALEAVRTEQTVQRHGLANLNAAVLMHLEQHQMDAAA